MVGVILAAGKGKRFCSSIVKPLHPLCGKPIIEYTLDLALSLESQVTQWFVVIPPASELQNYLAQFPKVNIAIQEQPLGTADALLSIEKQLVGYTGSIIVFPADMPLLTKDTISNMIRSHDRVAATLLVAHLPNPKGYGRIVRNPNDGSFIDIVEEADIDSVQLREIDEVNAGVYCFEAEVLFDALKQIKPQNVQKEYYLTDVFRILREKGLKIAFFEVKNPTEIHQINDRFNLAEVESILQERILQGLMVCGVTIINPRSCYIEASVKIGQDTILYPFTMILGKTSIGNNCRIGPSAYIENCQLLDNVEVVASYLRDSNVGNNVHIGPFAHIRPGVILEDKVKIGNFVELKAAKVCSGTKINHLSYIGDSEVGIGVNIGAGVITCNWDGFRKNRTVIHDGAFIGSNASLIAPVSIGREAVVAAGSTITDDVPDYALGIGRSRQKNIPNWVPKHRERHSGGKNT